MIVLLLIIVFTFPLLWWDWRYGIQPSISDYFRVLQKRYGKGSLIPWSFWLWLIAVGGLFFAHFQTGIAFGTLAGLVLTGAAAEFWKKHAELPHILGATGGILFAHVTIMYHSIKLGMFPVGLFVLGCGIGSALLLRGTKNETYWIEIVQFAVIIMGILLLDFV